MNVARALNGLLDFAVDRRLIEEEDRLYTRNLLLDDMRLASPPEGDETVDPIPETMTGMLTALIDDAVARGLIPDSQDERDRFSTRLSGRVTPEPARIRAVFEEKRVLDGAKAATDWFYGLCRDCDYIRVDQIAKNVRFFEDTPECGELEITINLSKPEKDPRDIAALKDVPQTGYPKCMLCVENPGYAGRPGFPARLNHRIIPLTLDGSRWYLQYSPYLYYDEHCIVLNHEHVPMRITEGTFRRLFDFVGQFPHYFIGSNADLPIVGGSILNHDHFQGGRYVFPMDRAWDEILLKSPVEGVTASVVDWPMTCIRLRGREADSLIRLAMEMLDHWRGYSDEALHIFAETTASHNTITPILRRDEDGVWILNLVLRNNRTSEEHPLGIYHPHAELHHIKKENIGLIEVMGLFILPGRLKTEMDALSAYLTGEIAADAAPGAEDPLEKHYDWVLKVIRATGVGHAKEAALSALYRSLAVVCQEVLKDAGVYKQTPEGRDGLMRFLRELGY